MTKKKDKNDEDIVSFFYCRTNFDTSFLKDKPKQNKIFEKETHRVELIDPPTV